MRGKIFLVMFILISGLEAQAEIYKTVDENGRVHFSDSPINTPTTSSSKTLKEGYQAAGYSTGYDSSSSSVKKTDSKALEKIANDLKKDRLQRKKLRKKELAEAQKKRKLQKKKIAAEKKKKKACKVARSKEDKAFRKRSNAKNLSQAESALENYEKKRDIRRLKCR